MLAPEGVGDSLNPSGNSLPLAVHEGEARQRVLSVSSFSRACVRALRSRTA